MGPTFERRPIYTAILSTIAAGSGAAHAQPAAIEEIVVTATKRASSAQDIPVTVKALNENTLDEAAITTFEDYVAYLPSLTSGGRGPGQQTAYIRGMAVQPITVLLSGAQGTTPNVAMYLDEQPVTAPGRNLDIYAADIERIEVLPGPQGTLFGASSQAGTIRLISNKPQFDAFGAGGEATVSSTRHGDDSYRLEAYLNVPVTERLALRGAFYTVELGGYIDNVAGTFTTDPAINPLSTATADAVFYEEASNVDLAKDNFNDSSYEGARLSGAYLINEDWEVLVQHTRQTIDADGVFDYDPAVGDLEVNRFFQDDLEDEFSLTTWTLNGRLAMLDMVYTGGYLDRDIEQFVDYTGYNNSGAFVNYYTCTYDNPAYVVNYGIDPRFITPGGRECLNPVKGTIIDQKQTRMTHEVRFNTPVEHRLRATFGFFYDDFEIETQDDYNYQAVTDLGFVPNAPISDAAHINPDTRAPGIAFFNDIRRTEEQYAVFGELAFDLIPETLEVIAGARYYDMELDFEGSSNFATGIFQGVAGEGVTDLDLGRDYDVDGGHTPDPLELDDVIWKFTLNWMPTQDMLVYGTYSQGFRPGGWNRGGGIPSVNPDFPTVSATYDTDDVDNYELGLKSTWFQGLMQFNANFYFIEWTNMQVSRFDPQNVSILTFIENAADSEIYGLEGDLIWNATANLTLYGAFSYNDTELTDVFGQAVELVEVGSPLPLTPEWQFSARGVYTFPMTNGYEPYAQLALRYADESYSSLVAANRRQQDAYTVIDATVGVRKDNWRAELMVQNLADEQAELFINNQDDIERITTNRPRTISLRVSYDLPGI